MKQKQEIIHPDENPDKFLWVFTLLFGCFQIIIGILFFIVNLFVNNRKNKDNAPIQ